MTASWTKIWVNWVNFLIRHFSWEIYENFKLQVFCHAENDGGHKN